MLPLSTASVQAVSNASLTVFPVVRANVMHLPRKVARLVQLSLGG